MSETVDLSQADQADQAVQAKPVGHPLSRLAGYIERAGPGERAALSRLDPQAMLPHQMAALSRALIHAGFDLQRWSAPVWRRWALIAQGMALAGHDGSSRLGLQLHNAGVAESRVTKLLVAREDALLQLMPRLVRLMASRQVKPNWHELGDLILKDLSVDPGEIAQLEDRRIRIAGDYFAAQARAR